MFETSHIEIDSERYRSNLAFIRNLIGPDVKICSVIKGNAYGHGSREVATLAQREGVRAFAVFSAREAFDVFEAIQPDSRLMIMGDVEESQLEWVIENGIEFFLHQSSLLDFIQQTAKKVGRPAKIHLELETGMNRFGISDQDMTKLLKTHEMPPETLKVMGICTHFSGAESISNFERVRHQIRKFERLRLKVKNAWGQNIESHAACSAACIRFPKTRYDLVRIGILQYGLWPSRETQIHHAVRSRSDEDPLRRIISWKSRIMSLKKVKRGEFVGYGTTYQASEDKLIGVVPVGYANGFSRTLSNQGIVLVRGRRIHLAGMVNMNATSIDVTRVPGIQIGDEVTLIGIDNDCEISISSFSDYSSQLNYELLTRLPAHIPRQVI